MRYETKTRVRDLYHRFQDYVNLRTTSLSTPPIKFYTKRTSHSVIEETTVYFVVKYVDSNEPLKIDIDYRPLYKTAHILIVINLNRRYDIAINGEPMFPSIYEDKLLEEFTALINLKKVSNSNTCIETTFEDILLLYLLEHRYNVVTLILNEYERLKEELRQREGGERAIGDFDSTVEFLKWIRDEMFPLLDRTIDISHVKNIEHIRYKTKPGEVYKLLSLLEFIAG